MYMLFLAIITLIATHGYESGPIKTEQKPTISVCTLVAQPAAYVGKEVRVSAVLISGSELSYLWDDSCSSNVNPATGKSDLLYPEFDEHRYNGKSALNKKLHKLLTKHQKAQVTVVGVFIDPGHYFGSQLCCRYQLEIESLESVEAVSGQSANSGGKVTVPQVPR